MKRTAPIASALLCMMLAASAVVTVPPGNSAFADAWMLRLNLASSQAEQALPEQELPEPITPDYPSLTEEILTGTWSGTFPVKVGTTESTNLVVQDHARISFDSGRYSQMLVALESDDNTYLAPVSWRIENNELYVSLNASPWRANIRLHLYDYNTLTGTYTQYGAERNITLWRDAPPEEGKESAPLKTDFIFEDKTEDEWLKILATYPNYTEGTAPIAYRYDLFNWQAGGSIAAAYHLDQLMETTKGYTDVERMKAIMDLVCANFKHDGVIEVPEEGLIPQEAVDYCLRNGAIECRGMSSILAEFLRLCNIPAKSIMCIPSIEPSQDCHVVVHAYSYDLGRWILLDPTYHLMLKTTSGSYANLSTLRQALINGETLIANEDAGHNGMPFSMQYYRAYMAKNTFRFSCATSFSSTDKEVGGADNRIHMLVPKGWTVPYQWSRPEILTTSADDFWAPPPPRLDWDESIPSIAGSTPSTETTDWFLYNGQKYACGDGIYWVSGQMQRFGEELGAIQRNDVIAEEMTDWDATVLMPGSLVYRFMGNDNLLIVHHGADYTTYYRVAA